MKKVGSCVLNWKWKLESQLSLSLRLELSHVWFFVTPWTLARQAPLSKGLFSQEYWSQLPFPSPGDLLTQGSNPSLLIDRRILLPLSHLRSPGKQRWARIDHRESRNRPRKPWEEFICHPYVPVNSFPWASNNWRS